ncbi:YraN family protein [Flavobacterium dauae]|uniref:YraN family protein n=1 Tax=Flavobacterium dauae TaxID=1563479 RepID=UPI00101B4015|nr:YraN family protein [Flavobacterium dauae]WLD23189.1 YraN family protein [Flavobacterium dauae]
MATHNDTGKQGEQLAKEYLQKNGYTILETNYRYKKAEIDIIATKENILAIIEVKTRTSTHFGEPESFVNNKKIKLILEATNAYIIEKDLDLEVSLDIISVIMGNETEINHIENAYYFF